MFKRIVSIFLVFTVLVSMLTIRLGFVSLSDNYYTGSEYNSYLIDIDSINTNFYYSDMSKINNNITQLVAVIEPNEKCIGELDLLFDSNQRKDIINELKKGLPVVRKIEQFKMLKYIKIIEIKATKNNCSQLLNKECKGLLSYCPDSIGSLGIRYSVDARGRILGGKHFKIVNDNYNSKLGYKTTINSNIQEITYDACSNLDKGCAVIVDVNNFEILSCVTKPDDSYLNKPFMQYNPGSVFKIVVALSAIENGIDLSYECNGWIKIGDTTFSCQNNRAHSKQHLKEALANSCNCYFVNLATELGSQKIKDTAMKFGFMDETNIISDWSFINSKFPNDYDLKSKGELALLGFGQGKITVTPLQMAYCLAIIGNMGIKKDISLISSQIDENQDEYNLTTKVGNQVYKAEYCKIMINYLRNVVVNGTGKRANDSANKSCGKTATAQTGQYKNGREMLNTWFVGLYPYDNPKYAIVVMKEDGSSGSSDCCPIFSTIVEKMNK